ARGTPVPLATQVSPQAAALDDAGRLWVLDPATGDLVWIDHGQPRSRRGVATPGAGLLVLADGDPVVVDTAARTATVLDPTDGSRRSRLGLDLRPGDRLQVSGSSHSPFIYLVADRGVLSICDLTATGCNSAVPLGNPNGLAVQITMNRPSAHVGEDIGFKVAAVKGPQPVSARWSFGDGQTGPGLQPSHSWGSAQTYVVGVVATFADRRTATASA